MPNRVPKKRYYDSNGNVVPKRLQHVFEASARVKTFVDGIVEKVVGAHDHAAKYEEAGISFPKIELFFLKTYTEIIQELPYVLCRCRGNPDCERCGGKGWMSQKDVSPTGLYSLEENSVPEADPIST